MTARFLLVLLGVLVLMVAPVSGQPQGGGAPECAMFIDGEPVGDDPAIVDEDAEVPFSVRAPAPIREYEVWAAFGPARSLVASDVGHSGSVVMGSSVPVADYTWFGVGLYTIEARIVMTDGSTCTVATSVVIEGNVLGTLMGLVGMGVLVGGVSGLFGAFIMGFMEVKEVRDAIKDFREEKARSKKWRDD